MQKWFLVVVVFGSCCGCHQFSPVRTSRNATLSSPALVILSLEIKPKMLVGSDRFEIFSDGTVLRASYGETNVVKVGSKKLKRAVEQIDLQRFRDLSDQKIKADIALADKSPDRKWAGMVVVDAAETTVFVRTASYTNSVTFYAVDEYAEEYPEVESLKQLSKVQKIIYTVAIGNTRKRFE